LGDAVLIAGGGPAGVQAALELARAGVQVHLVTASPFVKASSSTGRERFEEAHRILEAEKHPLVDVRTLTDTVSAGESDGRFSIRLRRRPRFVDPSRCTACGDCVDACPVTVTESGSKAVRLAEGAVPGCAIVDKQGTAPCTAACPGGIHVQGYVSLVAAGRFMEAFNLVERAIPFPGICGRICTHPCEEACRRSGIDSPVAIRLLKRFVSDFAQEAPAGAAVEVPAGTGPAVAVVGAGPAGISAARRLRGLGYRVTVFEKLPVIGGMMGVGIPGYRLPRDIIDREYDRIRGAGVEILLDTAVGPGGRHDLDDLFRMGYRAVLLAVGAHQSLKLNIPGESFEGVIQGLDLLRAIRLAQYSGNLSCDEILNRAIRRGQDTRAAVIGGGNTAVDAARTLRRLGLSDVRILYRRSRAEMPALPEEVHEAELEGVRMEFLTAPVGITGDEANGVAGLECVRMRLDAPDAGGRPRPVPIEGSWFLYVLDMVVPAVGQVPDSGFVDRVSGIESAPDHRIILPGGGFMTGRPGVFAAGDAVSGAGMTVIEAIGMGKKAAEEIDAYLGGGSTGKERPSGPRLPVSMRELSEKEKTPVPRVPVSTVPVSERTGGFVEVERGYTEAEAVAEAGRCLGCGPCGECLACEDVCEPGAIDHLQRETLEEISVKRIIYAGDPDLFEGGLFEGLPGVTRIPPDNPHAGSAAAAEILDGLPKRGVRAPEPATPLARASRIGVFVCRCGGEISNTVDTAAVVEKASSLPGVVYAAELSFSCTPDAAEIIREAAAEHRLDRVVVAGCTCCTLDQACYGCTFQRIRCKRNLGVLGKGGPAAGSAEWGTGLPREAHRFVNIREHCSLPHAGDEAGATGKAASLVAGAVAEAGEQVFPPMDRAVVDRYRCRSCGTCVEVCETGAARITASSWRSAFIDPAVCSGCGVCAALCPSGAITSGDSGRQRLTAVMGGVLS